MLTRGIQYEYANTTSHMHKVAYLKLTLLIYCQIAWFKILQILTDKVSGFAVRNTCVYICLYTD